MADHNLTQPPSEPALTSGAKASIVTAALALAAAFGLPLTDLQHDALLVFVGVAGPMLAAWWARRNVYSPATVRQLVDKARADGARMPTTIAEPVYDLPPAPDDYKPEHRRDGDA